MCRPHATGISYIFTTSPYVDSSCAFAIDTYSGQNIYGYFNNSNKMVIQGCAKNNSTCPYLSTVTGLIRIN